jgi:hypothetical protein
MKKTKYIGFRVSAEEFGRLEAVQSSIALSSRGQKPEITDIIRSILGWGNKNLVTVEERAFLAGEIPSIHGNLLPDQLNRKPK